MLLHPTADDPFSTDAEPASHQADAVTRRGDGRAAAAAHAG
jgi:hypothetical protein